MNSCRLLEQSRLCHSLQQVLNEGRISVVMSTLSGIIGTKITTDISFPDILLPY